MADASQIELLIVGGGPCGLVTAVAAARYGTRILVVEQREEGSSLSRALVISTRGMELMRRFGLEDAVRAGAADVESTALVTPSLASRGGGTVMPLGYPSEAEALVVSPTRPAWAPQNHHEPLLLKRLLEYPSSAVRFGARLVGLVEWEGGYRATLLDVASGSEVSIDAQYVVGADGAHSKVRSEIGIEMEGPDDLADYERVEFVASLNAAVGARAHALYVITDPAVGGAVLARRGREDRWSLSRERPRDARGFEALPEADLIDLVRRAIGIPDIEITVERLSRFRFAAQVAQRYRRGHVFLVGDAAHRMTPRGGTGMNTGIQDGFDLGWKVAWVLRGWAGPSLLQTYESERRPIALHNVGRSADAGGARRPTSAGLPWDLDGRVTHAWLDHDGTQHSTLDLIGDGLTVFAAADRPEWSAVGESLGWKAPAEVVVVDTDAAGSLNLSPTGAVLVRPDGHEIARWSDVTMPPVPGHGWLASPCD